MGQWGHLYGKRWRKRARHQLQVEPLCRGCKSEGRLTAASVVDHVVPHRGDINSFWLYELQSLCTFHHNSTKKIIEQRGYDTAIMTPRGVELSVNQAQAILGHWRRVYRRGYRRAYVPMAG